MLWDLHSPGLALALPTAGTIYPGAAGDPGIQGKGAEGGSVAGSELAREPSETGAAGSPLVAAGHRETGEPPARTPPPGSSVGVCPCPGAAALGSGPGVMQHLCR